MKTILSLCLFLFFLTSQAQTFDSTLTRYGNEFQTEKAYLQFDKSAYYPSETIWFKAYVLEGITPAVVSKTLYVDYIGDDGTVLSHIVSPLVDGVTNGQVLIPTDYKGNFLHVRAYTRWMLNFDTAFLFSSDIRILKTSPGQIAKQSARPSIAFFPEGGDMIADLKSKVAFKATDQWGRPLKVKGVIVDEKGSYIDSIKTIHDGMGYVSIQPVSGSKYTARWKEERGTVYTTDLPVVKNDGIAMHVEISGTKRIITVSAPNNSNSHYETLHLVGTLNQLKAFNTEIKFSGASSARRIIPTENLPSGILTITVFDSDWNAIAERITFINNHEFSFETSLEVKRWGLSKRKRNEFEITVPDNVQGANLSIAITDAAIERDSSSNILSQLLLTSELKGNVFHPAYYFSSDNDSMQQQLDLVMLTNGWRRFKWEDVAKGKLPQINYTKDTSYLNLSGKLFGVAKSQLSGKESIVLLVKDLDSSVKMLIVPINRDGTFTEPNIMLFDTVQVYYSLKSKLLSQAEARFMTERLPAPNYGAFSKNFIPADPNTDTTGNWYHSAYAAQANRLEEMRRGQVMEAVIIKTKTKAPVDILDEKYSSALFSGDGYKFDLVNEPTAGSYATIFDYLQGKVAGLMITTAGGTPSLSWRGGAPSLYLDEMPADADLLSNIPVSDVALVKVFRPPFTGGSNGGNGAIAIYTKRGNDARSTSQGLSKNRVTGYSPIREFYSPNYDAFDPRNDQADMRTTLYWNPVLSFNTNKRKNTVVFYNNDITRSFRVVIEGMSKEGLLTHFEQVVE
ncbi:MAG: hypothetical protein ACJ75F_06275 [Flavisolibacter sp.]|jgi:hypothetical protein